MGENNPVNNSIRQNFKDPVTCLESIYSLSEGMMKRRLKWNRKNKISLIMRIDEFIDNFSYVTAEKTYLYGVSFRDIIDNLEDSMENAHKDITSIFSEILGILNIINKEHTLRLSSFEEFSKYIIRHKLISTNKEEATAKIKYSPSQKEILKYGFLIKNWDIKLVKLLISGAKKIEPNDIEVNKDVGVHMGEEETILNYSF